MVSGPGVPGQCLGKNQANLSYYLQTLRLELHCSWLHASPYMLAVSTTRPYLMRPSTSHPPRPRDYRIRKCIIYLKLLKLRNIMCSSWEFMAGIARPVVHGSRKQRTKVLRELIQMTEKLKNFPHFVRYTHQCYVPLCTAFRRGYIIIIIIEFY